MRVWLSILLFLAPPLWVLTHQQRPEPPTPPPTPPLVQAAERGDLERLEALLGRTAGVDARDACRWTPLMKAALNGHGEVVRRLLAAGADVDAQDKGGYTALMLAASNDHADIVRMLYRAGADLNHREHTHGWSALGWARRLGHRRTVALLRRLGAEDH